MRDKDETLEPAESSGKKNRSLPRRMPRLIAFLFVQAKDK